MRVVHRREEVRLLDVEAIGMALEQIDVMRK
jgi:hypothetical protein